MRIAIPVENGLLSAHFGHASQFALVDVSDGKVTGSRMVTPPPHEPGALPRWLAEEGATHVICGGIGARAVELIAASGIQVVAGVPVMDPSVAVEEFLKGNLSGASGPTCQGHGHGEHQCNH